MSTNTNMPLDVQYMVQAMLNILNKARAMNPSADLKTAITVMQEALECGYCKIDQYFNSDLELEGIETIDVSAVQFLPVTIGDIYELNKAINLHPTEVNTPVIIQQIGKEALFSIINEDNTKTSLIHIPIANLK